MSSNLRNAEYYIRNQKVSPDEYKAQVAELTKDYASIQRL